MRRNLGSEVLIAVVALSVIICALFFALLLSTTSDNPPATNISSSMVTAESVTAVSSNVEDEATSDVTEPSATHTEQPTDTPEPSATHTEQPTDTPEPTATHTEQLTDTPEPSATHTEQPTDTPEPTATHTEQPTDTPEPTATHTEQPTDTPEPSATHTEQPTDTPEPTATHTERPTDTPEPSATYTERPTATTRPNNTLRPTATSTSSNVFLGIIPTLPPSPTVAPLDDPTRTPASCQLPRGWTTYTVQSGDTVFAISLVTNSTVDELRFINCLDDVDNITTGDVLFVPIAPVRPVATIVPSGIRQGLVSVGCSSPNTQITSPVTAQRVSGTFNVIGTATRSDFQYYKIEVRPDFADIYNFYSDSRTQVSNGVLGQINADLFGAGLHWIRLSVVDLRASIAPDAICEIPVIFE
ncbi:MAG: LysM peptidoglycan-binding domain-containing protein [Anaerolineae bacterium]